MKLPKMTENNIQLWLDHYNCGLTYISGFVNFDERCVFRCNNCGQKYIASPANVYTRIKRNHQFCPSCAVSISRQMEGKTSYANIMIESLLKSGGCKLIKIVNGMVFYECPRGCKNKKPIKSVLKYFQGVKFRKTKYEYPCDHCASNRRVRGRHEVEKKQQAQKLKFLQEAIGIKIIELNPNEFLYEYSCGHSQIKTKKSVSKDYRVAKSLGKYAKLLYNRCSVCRTNNNGQIIATHMFYDSHPDALVEYSIGKYRLDAFSKEDMVALEYDGSGHHSSTDKAKELLCRKNGIKLIRMNEKTLENVFGVENLFR